MEHGNGCIGVWVKHGNVFVPLLAGGKHGGNLTLYECSVCGANQALTAPPRSAEERAAPCVV